MNDEHLPDTENLTENINIEIEYMKIIQQWQ